jgi:glycosyltransferase involved in cell wall biosynthesis
MNYKAISKKYPNIITDIGDKSIHFNNYEAIVDEETAYRLERVWHENYNIVGGEVPIPFNPDSWKKEKRLIWSCNYASANGYGNVAENTVKQLLNKGYRVLNPGSVSNNPSMGGNLVDDKVFDSLNQQIIPDCLEIQHCQPPAFRSTITQRHWIYTMYETTHTPQSWIDIMNKAEVVLTPSSWIIPYWQEQGLTSPIEVYPHGINPENFPYMDRPDRETYTFLHYGQLSIRKGTDLVVKAFNEEFWNEPNVRLILKNTYPMFPVPMNIPKTQYISATYTKEQMKDMLFNSDCLVIPSRGEGFSLAPLECMATGMPVITTNWSGMTDYCTKEDTLLCDYDMVRSTDFDDIYRNCYGANEDSGYWSECKLESLKSSMRWCFEHRAEAKAMGKKASVRIQRDYSWSKSVDKLLAIIQKYI